MTYIQLIVLTSVLFGASVAKAEDVGIRAPEGFEVSLYADDDLAHDIFSMTIDPRGRVVVAGRGYVKILHDTDDDGRADKATLFSEFPKSGAHGMVFVGNDLIATGDNLLMRLRDEDADGVADGRPIPLANVKSPEHGANGLAQGPDGWIYMICGNDAGVGSQLARTETSPVKKPQAGAVVRFSPDFKTSEIFAHGFRNPYDLAFNANGHLFTVDADGERDQYLPWYTPTRLFDIQQGMHHGWVQRGWTRSWNRPECFFDNVERLVEIGRGSPTGVACYRHYAFPAHYRGGIYSCCWTLGNVYYFPLTREGSSYKSRKEIFLQTAGDVGFAPVDLAVGPQGDMFVAIGGRGTRGSVFRVRYTGELKLEEQPPEMKHDLDRVLNAPQPLSAWSRAKWMPLAEKIGADSFISVAVNDDFLPDEQIRAIEIAKELFGGVPIYVDRSLFSDSDDRVIARAIWALGAAGVPRASDAVEERLFRASGVLQFGASPLRGVVDRSLWEALVGRRNARSEVIAELSRGFPREGRRTRIARLLALNAMESRNGDGGAPKEFPDALQGMMRRALENALQPGDFHEIMQFLDLSLDVAAESRPEEDHSVAPAPFGEDDRTVTLRRDHDPPASLFEFLQRGEAETTDDGFPEGVRARPQRELARARPELARAQAVQRQINVVRLLQLCLGDIRVEPSKPDVYAGYTANAPEEVEELDRRRAATALTKTFPTGEDSLDREIARLVGMLEVEGDYQVDFCDRLTKCWTLKSRVEDDIHYLIVLSCIGGQCDAEITNKTAAALAFLHVKMLVGDMYPSRNWPRRVGETFVELCKRDPNLAEALARHRDFGLPQHAMFAKLMPEKQRKLAARRLLQRAQQAEDDVPWTPEMVELIAELDQPEALDAIRAQWGEFSLRDAIIAALYGDPQPGDRELFVDALMETNPATVARAADALAMLGQAGEPDEIAAALSALRHYCSVEEAAETRRALGAAINTMSKKDFEFEETEQTAPLATYQPALDWFAEAHPAANARLNNLAALDGIDWDGRLAKIDWTAGNAQRGGKIYESRSCAKCHSGRNRLGPGLEGVTGRWSPPDLIKEIVQPNRNVAPQFLTSRLVTQDGKIYQGVPVYQSPDGTLLQTGPNETVRIAGPQVVSISKSRTSLMPTGLLRGLSDAEIADLYAYLKTLSARSR